MWQRLRQRVAVRADLLEAGALLRLLRRGVAGGAETLQLTFPKERSIPLMRDNVIRDSGRGVSIRTQTECAEGVRGELPLPDPAPAPRIVPRVTHASLVRARRARGSRR